MYMTGILSVWKIKQAGAELGQAQLKLELGALWLKFIATNMINKKYLARSLVSFCSLSRPTWHFMPFKSDLKYMSYA